MSLFPIAFLTSFGIYSTPNESKLVTYCFSHTEQSSVCQYLCIHPN